ncbi:trafficking protein particle complex subunit 10 [Suillus clintonianus]|uniref:trafficking protein particle complex subunit 10 n=1 Tax=Suillus clintonianus TaxID=1904413 RepID=UPI001B8709AB|nr:trafficking protein particle complex subunit 10 [Suillus clintonianus]KAG2157362.1 trafficking protein particle complex subunit 10 [Suillus clintonianus]
MSNQNVLVTYSAPVSFLASESWKQVLAALQSQLPLRSIHWKSAFRPNLKTIQELELTLVPLDSLRDEHTSQVPVTLLEKPLLNLYVVTCEDNDLYRTNVKKQIKDWHSAISQRKHQEWIIVHVVRSDIKTTDRKFFNMKSSVLDKIKADFNIDKRDRCVQLSWTAGDHSPVIWADLMNKIKDGLLAALDSSVSQREEEVRRSESQRQMPGWNFCTFFLLKACLESLASSFEGVKLFEDALHQYNELEVSFIQVLREKNMSWFGSLIQPVDKDDSVPLLSVTKKHYRDLILANSISVFDFRIYLLARQCALLNKMRRPFEICQKVTTFLGTFSRRLREVEARLPEYFIESWIFSSALSVVNQCDTWAPPTELDGIQLARFSASKGELLELAKTQLDIIGVKVGHLPKKPPFATTYIEETPATRPQQTSRRSSTQRISNHEIMLAIGDEEAFYDLYCATSNRAIDMYVKAGRRKFALKLHGFLAALDIHRGRLANALAIFTSLPAHYAPHMWTSLESFVLSRAIDIHAELEKPQDREWIHILLAYLRTYTNDISKELASEEEGEKSVTQLITALHAAAKSLDSDLIHTDHTIMAVQVSGDATCSDDEDLALVDATISNHLPCDIFVDEISITLRGRDSERLKFTAKVDKLPPGQSTVTLSCPSSSWGLYTLESSEVVMARVRFQWQHTGTAITTLKKNHTSLVRVSRSLRALDVQIRQPQQTELGATSRLLLIISTGQNDISRATIKPTPPSGVQFNYSAARLEAEGTGTLEGSDNAIVLLDAPVDTDVVISLPHSDASRYHTMKIGLSVTYNTQSSPGVIRTLQTSRVVTVSLPIAVNVEDFFRGKRLFSKFTISTTSHQHVRISSTELQGPRSLDGVKISGCRPNRPVVNVTPEHAVNFLFSIESSNGPVLEPLNLVIKYRVLRDEVEALIRQTVEAVLLSMSVEKLQYSSLRRSLIDNLVAHLESDAEWVETYRATGEIILPRSFEDGSDFQEPIREALAQCRPETASSCPWREIKIPVDVPRMNIVTAAQITVQPSSLPSGIKSDQLPPIYAGQPIQATLIFKTSFHWAEKEGKQRCYTMRYDVEERVKDWLLCGRKRGDFVATDGGSFAVPLTLIALHHGEISLPKVNVRPLPISMQASMGSTVPSADACQVHGAEKVLILPRGGRSTYIVGMGSDNE